MHHVEVPDQDPVIYSRSLLTNLVTYLMVTAGIGLPDAVSRQRP